MRLSHPRVHGDHGVAYFGARAQRNGTARAGSRNARSLALSLSTWSNNARRPDKRPCRLAFEIHVTQILTT